MGKNICMDGQVIQCSGKSPPFVFCAAIDVPPKFKGSKNSERCDPGLSQ